jgi:hypothetical protein
MDILKVCKIRSVLIFMCADGVPTFDKIIAAIFNFTISDCYYELFNNQRKCDTKFSDNISKNLQA